MSTTTQPAQPATYQPDAFERFASAAVADAAELGWAPGENPREFYVLEDGQHVRYAFDRAEVQDGDVLAWRYRPTARHAFFDAIRVFND